MARVTVTAMADGNVTEMTVAMVDGNRNGNGRQQRQRQWAIATAMAMTTATELATAMEMAMAMTIAMAMAKATITKEGLPLHVAAMCSTFGGGDTLPPPPWTQRKVHSPALRHGGDTAKSVCSPSRGRVPDSSPWIVFVYFLQLLFSLLNNPLFASHIIQALKNPVSPLTLYLLHSSKNHVSLLTIYPSSYCTFCQGEPGQGLQ